MDRLSLLTAALERAESLHLKYPQVATISIIRQLDYLVQVETNASIEGSRSDAIIVGIQAAREIEPLDEGLAELLYNIQDQVRPL